MFVVGLLLKDKADMAFHNYDVISKKYSKRNILRKITPMHV